MERKQCKLFFRNCCKEENVTSIENNHQTNEHNEVYYISENKEMHEQVEERPIINVKGDQPVFNIPVYQDKYIRDRIIETPKYEIQDVIQPKQYTQETKHDLPTVELLYKERKVNVSQEKIKETPVEVDMPIGYTPIFSPIWDVREIPRVIPKYEGQQKVIEVEIPQIKYIDKFVEKEIIVDVKEKIIPKITQVEKQVDIVKYEWKEKYQDVPVCKYVPKIDVELDCPPPLIVPYPEVHFQNMSQVMNPNQRAADIPPELLLRNSSLFNNAFTADAEPTGIAHNSWNNYVGDNCEGNNYEGDNYHRNDFHRNNYDRNNYDSGKYDKNNYHHERGYKYGNSPCTSNMHVGTSVKKSLLDAVRLNSKNSRKDKQQRESQTMTYTELKKKRNNNNWPFCTFKNCNDLEKQKHLEDIDPQTGYPLSMPKDFAAFFKDDLNTVKKQLGEKNDTKSTISSNLIEKSPVNPTIEYLGKIDKPPIDGGKLDSISFKLHAIEVHQFIPVPSLPKPKFLDIVPPEHVQNNDISSLQNVFGQVPEGWVDPNITGFIAPMMYDILQGNVQPQSPLFNKLSIAKENITGSYPSMHVLRKEESNSGSRGSADIGQSSGNIQHRGSSNGNYMQTNNEPENESTNNIINYNTNSSLNYVNENNESYDTLVN
ncbi:inner membrane complex protein 1j [Plasmodium gonderi]|uniref:Inner membrane complex protein 1j n=1 Tax=Plasmodium gonderi TaxID=77519 RepID=A0A1Y1JK73_PLAGO|nr:inner membrane complex protein 1j [Plasmodium gonderi]GAW81815.1 inner membrane complex protein 1j [Plasmodium gonderi]